MFLLRAKVKATVILVGMAGAMPANAPAAKAPDRPGPLASLFGSAPPRLQAAENRWVVSNARVQRTIRYDPARKARYPGFPG